MLRDWEIIRAILLRLEQHEAANAYLNASHLTDWPEQEVAYNMRLLDDEGAIKGKFLDSSTGDGKIIGAIATRLTSRGHDLLDSMRTRSVWDQIQKAFKENAISMTVEMVILVGAKIMRAKLGL